eukprot:scaffold46371_cov42-Phaeocystis_antarctica.AAC.1
MSAKRAVGDGTLRWADRALRLRLGARDGGGWRRDGGRLGGLLLIVGRLGGRVLLQRERLLQRLRLGRRHATERVCERRLVASLQRVDRREGSVGGLRLGGRRRLLLLLGRARLRRRPRERRELLDERASLLLQARQVDVSGLVGLEHVGQHVRLLLRHVEAEREQPGVEVRRRHELRVHCALRKRLTVVVRCEWRRGGSTDFIECKRWGG